MATTWDALAPLFDRDGLTRDAPAVIALVRAALVGDDPVAKAGALANLARGLPKLGLADRVVSTLSLSTDVNARRLALELATRLPPPLETGFILSLTPLVRDRRLPPALLLGATAALVRAARRDRRACVRVWSSFAEGYGKRQLLADQLKLRKRFAGPRQFDHFCTLLRRRVPLKCPRCNVRVASARMPRHLWRRHGRLFDAGRVRKPWQFLDAAGPDADPSARLTELHRLMQRYRLGEVAAKDELLATAADEGKAVCPHCWALVPVPLALARPCDVTRGRVSGRGYAFEVCEGVWWPRLRVTSPDGVLFDGPEPGAALSPAARRFAAAGPLVLLAMAVAVLVKPPFALLATASVLLLALILHRLAARRRGRPPGDRAIDHAWRFLAFDPESGRVPAHDADFLTGLARASVGRGDPVARSATVRLWADALDPSSAGVWAAFQALDAADTLTSGGEPVDRVAEAVGGCFDGKRPLAAVAALAELGSHAEWSSDRTSRLRVLLAERAFAAGFGVWDIHEIGRTVPALGEILGSADPDGLARLHRVWTLQRSRPWSKCGPAASAFEVAHYPDLSREHFAEAGDLLLYLPMRCDGRAMSLILCGRGVLFRNRLMADRSVPVAYWPRKNSDGGGYEMVFGTSRLAFVESPEQIAVRLQAWADYWFREFVPQAGDALATPAGPAAAALLRPLATPCPTCRTPSVDRAGQVGVRVP